MNSAGDLYMGAIGVQGPLLPLSCTPAVVTHKALCTAAGLSLTRCSFPLYCHTKRKDG